DRNRSHWSTSKTPSYTKSVSWQHHLRNQCNGSWQLTFNVDEWQNSDINSAMYQNLEKLLNTVQKC
ncbi:hypothetical protein AB2906_17775, partial [Escherichia coli]